MINNPNDLPEEETSFDFGLKDILSAVTDNSTENTGEDLNDADLLNTINATLEGNIINPNTSVNTEKQPVQYDENVYNTALTVLKEAGIFEVPDNLQTVDDEIWQAIIQDNKEKYKHSILEEMRQNAADPKIVELFDYVYNGGTWFGAEQMIDTIQNEIDIHALNTRDEDHQRYLIESYLTEGLDPNNPAHARRLENIPNEIATYFDRLEAEDIANEAKQYFLEKVNLQKEQIAAQQEEHNRQQKALEEEARRTQAEWANTFRNTLNERGWNDSKKKEIVSQFDIVELDNGQNIPMWKYKFDSIWANPKATQVFMDFISDYDPYTHEFKRNGVPTTKQVTSTIQNIINAKNQNKSKSQHSDQRQVATTIKTIDPRNV